MNLTFVPLAATFWQELPPLFIILQILSAVLWLVISVMTLITLRDVENYIKDDDIRRDLSWLLSCPAFVSTTCIVGNSLPRSSELLYAVGLTYLMVCLLRLVDLVYKLFGGRQNFARWLTHNSLQVLNLIGTISALTGVYITHILLKMTERFNFDIAFKNWTIGYTDIMSSEANGMFFFNTTMIIGCFILCIVQFIQVRPRRCALFDTHLVGRTVSIRRSRRTLGQIDDEIVMHDESPI